MDTRLRNQLLGAYSKDVGEAYKELTRAVKALREQQLDSVEYRKAMARVTGICGAECSAASKRLMRAVVLDALEKAKTTGLDITPTVAQHVAERLLGRGVDKRSTLDTFATPGRTAANKSPVGAADLVDIEAAIKAELERFAAAMAEIKDSHAQIYKAEVKA